MTALRGRSLLPGERIRVLVVDDSVVMRRLIARALEPDPTIEIVGSAPNGAIALQRIPALNPHLLTLDIEMPEMDGLETLRRVRAIYPQLRVIMCSTLTERGAAVTLEALALGADDYVTKSPTEKTLDHALDRLREDLIPRIKQFFPAPLAGCNDHVPNPAASAAAGWRDSALLPIPAVHARAVAIGTSTGGPAALGAVLSQIPAAFPLPVLVVQHMPPLFTRLLAERLASQCKLPMQEAQNGEPLSGGRIFIAPGDFHMKVAANGKEARVLLDQSPPQNFCRPAVDALFCSLAEVYGGAVIAAVLTGMGQDGLRGASILKAHGAAIVAQDQQSSVVWGMPGAVVHAGLADRVVPLDQCAHEILRLAGAQA